MTGRNLSDDAIRKVARLVRNDRYQPPIDQSVRRRQQPYTPVNYFELAEDATAGGKVKAFRAQLNEANGNLTVDNSFIFDLWFIENTLVSPTRAKAGYRGIYSWDDEGREVFVFGPCIGTGCNSATGQINDSTLPNATVGSAYSHLFDTNNIASLAGNFLPPDMSIVNGELTGTPSQPGVYWIQIQGTGTDNCIVTKMFELQITNASGGFGD